MIQERLKKKVFLLFLQTSWWWGGGRLAPGSDASSSSSCSLFIIHISAWYYSDSHLSFFHTSYMYFYIHHTHIFINIHNWVCTSGLNLAHRSQRVQGTITILKKKKRKMLKWIHNKKLFCRLSNMFTGQSKNVISQKTYFLNLFLSENDFRNVADKADWND